MSLLLFFDYLHRIELNFFLKDAEFNSAQKRYSLNDFHHLPQTSVATFKHNVFFVA